MNEQAHPQKQLIRSSEWAPNLLYSYEHMHMVSLFITQPHAERLCSYQHHPRSRWSWLHH